VFDCDIWLKGGVERGSLESVVVCVVLKCWHVGACAVLSVCGGLGRLYVL